MAEPTTQKGLESENDERLNSASVERDVHRRFEYSRVSPWHFLVLKFMFVLDQEILSVMGAGCAAPAFLAKASCCLSCLVRE